MLKWNRKTMIYIAYEVELSVTTQRLKRHEFMFLCVSKRTTVTYHHLCLYGMLSRHHIPRHPYGAWVMIGLTKITEIRVLNSAGSSQPRMTCPKKRSAIAAVTWSGDRAHRSCDLIKQRHTMAVSSTVGRTGEARLCPLVCWSSTHAGET